MLKLALRTIGMLLGLLAAALMLIVDILYSLTHALSELAGHNTGNTTTFFIGLMVTIFGLVGALLADPWPMASVAMMVVAAVVFFFLVGAWALIPAVFFAIAILIVFFDRRRHA